MSVTDIGERLKSFRKSRNYSQTDLGKVVGKTAASISDWEKGKTRPPLEDILKISDALNCNPAQLAFGSAKAYGGAASVDAIDGPRFSKKFGYRARTILEHLHYPAEAWPKILLKSPSVLDSFKQIDRKPFEPIAKEFGLSLDLFDSGTAVTDNDRKVLAGLGLATGEEKKGRYPEPKAESYGLEEFLQEYREKSVDRDSPTPPLIFDPKWRDEEARTAVTLADVLEHLRPWLDAGRKDPNIPPVMLHQLKKHLPHSDLEED